MSKPVTHRGGINQSGGPPPPLPPRWKREWRIIRLKGVKVWWRGLWSLRRFHKSLEKLP